LKYYLLKVDDNEHWYARNLQETELFPIEDKKMVELSNFDEEGYFIQREVRVNIEERN